MNSFKFTINQKLTQKTISYEMLIKNSIKIIELKNSFELK